MIFNYNVSYYEIVKEAHQVEQEQSNASLQLKNVIKIQFVENF